MRIYRSQPVRDEEGRRLDENDLARRDLLPADPSDGCVLVWDSDEHFPHADAEQIERADRTSFKIWSPSQIWAPLEPPEYLVGGLLVRGSLGLLVAYGASLKTWLLEDAALSVATGGRWLDRFETAKGAALIIDFESGDYELRRRAHRIAQGRAMQTPVDGFAFVTMPETSLVDDAFYVALRRLAREYQLIGIDSLAAASGGIDENDARFATSLNKLKAIATETGCVILVLHHSRKSGDDKVDPRELVRGTSAIFNACDVVLMLTRAKDDGSFVVRQTKARAGRSVDPFVVRVEDVSEDASVVVGTDVPAADDEQAVEASEGIDRAKRSVLLLLGREHDVRSASEVHRRVRGNKQLCLAAVRELEERGTITKLDGAYRLSSEVRS